MPDVTIVTTSETPAETISPPETFSPESSEKMAQTDLAIDHGILLEKVAAMEAKIETTEQSILTHQQTMQSCLDRIEQMEIHQAKMLEKMEQEEQEESGEVEVIEAITPPMQEETTAIPRKRHPMMTFLLGE